MLFGLKARRHVSSSHSHVSRLTTRQIAYLVVLCENEGKMDSKIAVSLALGHAAVY